MKQTYSADDLKDARIDYYRWLLRRYGSSDLREMVDSPDPISLRQLYIPVRLSKESIDEDRMAAPAEVVEKESAETMHGEDGWAVVVRERFLMISGLPGSGKSTLIKSIIGEICSNGVSDFRQRLIEQRGGCAPIPLILREIPDIDTINSLDELLDRWFFDVVVSEQPSLDGDRLRQSFDPAGENFPAIYLFDGLDEIGGIETRRKIMQWAREAVERGQRVLITGRPEGFRHLTEEAEVASRWPCYHLAPLPWPLIYRFVHDWYSLRTEWQHSRKQGIPAFLDAMQDAHRPWLLILARRPIFLTLMALIHCTRNEMPHGRAELYESIVDIYLHRQERHRQLKYAVTDGELLPHWPPLEMRMVLGYLAWRSQHLGGETEGKADQRRIIWSRADMCEAIRGQLEGRRFGRFSALKPENAAQLLDYFLHPAGLLIEPAEGQIQFAHLSFQEYLCAWFIESRLGRRSFDADIERELFAHLGKAGWQEVALLLLFIHARRTSNDGHFVILSLLDLGKGDHAQLLVHAVCGMELPFSDAERVQWLPLLMAAALIHPDKQFGTEFGKHPVLEAPALALIKPMITLAGEQSGDGVAAEQWQLLLAMLRESLPSGFDDEIINDHTITTSLPKLWIKADAEQDDAATADDARMAAILALLADSGWGGNRDDLINPLADTQLEDLLTVWVKHRGTPALWQRGDDNLPMPTLAALNLDALLPKQGSLYPAVAHLCSLDGWLLQGEIYNDFIFHLVCQPAILFSLYPASPPPPVTQLSLLLYQLMINAEAMAEGDQFDHYSRSRSRSWSWSWSRSLSLSRSLSRLGLRSWSRSRLRALLRSRSRSLLMSRSRSLSMSLSMSLSLSRSLSLSLSRLLSLKDALQRLEPLVDQLPQKQQESLAFALELFNFNWAAFDWFSEQAESPELMMQRGLHPAEPLPQTFGLFDAAGRLNGVQQRENWLRLRAWTDDFDAIIAFAFPKGIADDERSNLHGQFKTLQTQPWSPQAALDAVLADWHEDQPERVCTIDASEARLCAVCEGILAEDAGLRRS